MELPPHVSEKIRRLKKAERVLIVTHHDADGVSSAGVILRSLEADLIVLRQLYSTTLENLPLGDYDFVLFTDLGGRYLEEIAKRTEEFLVVDHHDLADLSFRHLFHPSQMGYDPDSEASSSTLSALLSYHLNPQLKTLVYGLVGAAGDRQFVGGRFSGLNRVFVVKGIRSGILTVYRDLAIPSLRYKGLGDALLSSTDPVLPGITGNPEGVYNVLERSGILELDPSGRIRYDELDLEHKKSLYTAIHLHLLSQGWDEEKLRSLIGEVYEINGNPVMLSTVRGFAVVANAVGKTMHVDLVAPLFRGERDVMFKLYEVSREYSSVMYKAVRWASERASVGRGFAVADLRGRFPPFVSGAVAEVLSKYGVGVAVVDDEDGFVKLSLRGGSNLSALVEKLTVQVGGEGGGHSRAAGARIPEDRVEEFLELLSKELES